MGFWHDSYNWFKNGGRGRAEWSYGLPIAGNLIYNYDSFQDRQQMAKDFAKNTGRSIKYGTQGYTARSYSSLGSSADSVVRLAGKTYRKLV